MTRSPLAVSYSLYDGAVVFWYMPYTTYLNNVVQRKFETIIPSDQWGEYERLFVMFEANVVDAEFSGGQVDARALAWQAYWQSRDGDLEHHWNAFVANAALFMSLDFWTGWNATRDRTFDGDGALAQGADPKDERDSSQSENLS